MPTWVIALCWSCIIFFASATAALLLARFIDNGNGPR